MIQILQSCRISERGETMSHFYGSLLNPSRPSPATKQGHKPNGLKAHVRTWDRGVMVEAIHNKSSGTDSFAVTITGGSNNSSRVSGVLFQVTGNEVILSLNGKRLKTLNLDKLK